MIRQQHISNIEDTLKNVVERIEIAGSVSKGTNLRGLSDVDLLGFIPSYYQKKDPNQILESYAKLLRKRIPNTNITVGKIAITIHYSKVECQILPVIKVGDGIIRIAENGKWSKPIQYRKFHDNLKTTCSKYRSDRLGNVALSTIKYVKKAIYDNISSDLCGYHIECMCEEALRRYGRNKIKAKKSDLIEYCFHYMAHRVLIKTLDVTGQSYSIDDKLGHDFSAKRIAVSKEMTALYKKIRKDGYASMMKKT